MEENYGQFQGGTRMPYRAGRPNTRPPFNSRGAVYQSMPANSMQKGFSAATSYPHPSTFNRNAESHFNQNRGAGRGFCRPISMNRLRNVHGPQGGTDMSGRVVPLYEPMSHFPHGMQMQFPPLSLPPIQADIPPGTQQWSYQNNQQFVFDHQSQRYVTPVFHQIPLPPVTQEYVMPQPFTMPPPMQCEFKMHPPIQCVPLANHPQNNCGTIYYDPRQGYFTNGTNNPMPEPINSHDSNLNADAPSYNNTNNGVTNAELVSRVNNNAGASESGDGHRMMDVEMQEIPSAPAVNQCDTQPKPTWKNNHFVNDSKSYPETEIPFRDLLHAKSYECVLKLNQSDTLLAHKEFSTEFKEFNKNFKSTQSIQSSDAKDKTKDDNRYDGSVLQPNNQREIFDFGQLNKLSEEYRRAELAKLTPIVKDVYIEDSRVARMSQQEVKELREKKRNICVSYIKPEELSVLSPAVETTDVQSVIPIPNPVETFEDCFRNYPDILQQIANQGFTEPSPIQCQLWPCIMRGLDVVGIAQTGSGKTLAFLLPALIHIERQQKPRGERNSPTVLILAPTRELAQQIDKEVNKYSYRNIRSVCLYGGGSRQEQIEAVSVQTEIIIATPGRLNDLVQADKLNLKEVSMLILDEADEMLDQGFEPQINKALLRVRGDRQTILTSATWPASVRRMVQNYTKNPVLVVVGTTDLRAVTSVKQNIVFIEEDEKLQWLVDFLKNMSPVDKAIVFVGKKALADHISSELALMNIIAQCIHGALDQSDREQAIADMQSGVARILIATDVAARGIDIENVTHIINHDFPRCVEQYVHRIGRTGRAGRKGEAHTFISYRDWSSAQQLVEILQHAEQEVPEELLAMAERFKNRGGAGGRGRGRGAWVDRRGGGFHNNSSDFGFRGGYGDHQGGRGDFGERRGYRQNDGDRSGRRGGYGGGHRGQGSGFQY